MQIGSVTPPQTERGALWVKAQELEVAFIAEMLGHAGMGASSGQFGGGIGEEQFISFMREAQAKAMVESGGIGLAQRLFEALGGRDGA